MRAAKAASEGDLLVLNDTVIPRLFGRRGGVSVEATLIEELAPGRWRALARPARRLRPGDRVEFAPGFAAEVTSKNPEGTLLLDFGCTREAMAENLDAHGAAPLPPYIRRHAPDARSGGLPDRLRRAAWAVAAPTAGLHFTPELLAALDAAGVGRTSITLHVGAGTFLPVKTERIEDHVMHAERGEICARAADAVEACRAGGRVVAVGTTTLRLIKRRRPRAGRSALGRGDRAVHLNPAFGLESPICC